MDPLDCEAVEETAEDLAAELRDLEVDLAREFAVRGQVRLELLRRVRAGEIKETPRVSKWLGVYGAYIALLEHQPPDGLTTEYSNEKEAAESGLSFLVAVC